LLSFSFELLSFFIVFAGFVLFTFLRLVVFTVVDFCCTVVLLTPVVTPEGLLLSGFLTTVVDDLLVVTFPFPFDLFTMVLFVTVVGEFPGVPEFLLYAGLFTDLFVTVVFVLLVVTTFPLGCPTFFAGVSDLLSMVLGVDILEDLLY